MNPDEKKFVSPVLMSTTTTEPRVLTPAEIARPAFCHRNTVVRVAEYLQLDPIRTGHGDRLYSQSQAEAIISEIERRRMEAFRK